MKRSGCEYSCLRSAFKAGISSVVTTMTFIAKVPKRHPVSMFVEVRLERHLITFFFLLLFFLFDYGIIFQPIMKTKNIPDLHGQASLGTGIMRRKREKEVLEVGIGQSFLVLLSLGIVLKLTFTVNRLSSQET